MIDGQCIYVIRPNVPLGEDLLCLGKGERRGDLFRVQSTPHVLAPSGQWKVTALVQPWGYGARRFHLFDYWDCEGDIPWTMTTDYQRGDFWTYKNGKPRWTVRDLDHGTTRQWGGGIRKVSRWPVHTVLKDITWRLGNLDMTRQSAQTRAEVRRQLVAIRDFINANA